MRRHDRRQRLVEDGPRGCRPCCYHALILLLSVVGSCSANKNVFDLWAMLEFGVGGYLLRRLGYQVVPFAFAMVMGERPVRSGFK